MDGIVLTGDLFDVGKRLAEIDSGYFLLRRRGRFEVHHRRERPTLCLVVPYDSLDARTVDLVRKTRAERAEQIFSEIERHNESLRRSAVKQAAEQSAEVTMRIAREVSE